MIGLKTDRRLLRLLESAKAHKMTPEERYEQRRSFARGMCPARMNYSEWCKIVDEVGDNSQIVAQDDLSGK